jgi:hypothetical protein
MVDGVAAIHRVGLALISIFQGMSSSVDDEAVALIKLHLFQSASYWNHS